MTTGTKSGVAAALALLAMCACRPQRVQGAPAGALRTTSGEIALSNLDVQIASEERQLEADPRSVTVLASLVDLLLTRAQVTGTTDALHRADAYARRAATVPGEAGRGRMARAAVHAALHRFGEALDELTAAERNGADPLDVKARRGAILNARGELDAALAIRRELGAARPGITTLGQLAITEAARGDASAARTHFAEALAAYRDTSPIPVAWIEFQRGQMADAAGAVDDAARDYAAALARLPRYAEAAAHLAALEQLRGRLDRAEALLRPLAAPGHDPQYAAQLAAVLAARGASEEAARLRADARARYDRLLATHPEAYADHAARFLLQYDPSRALALARTNLSQRRTWEAYDLVLAAADRAGAVEEGCRVAAEALARPALPERILLAANRALARRCSP